MHKASTAYTKPPLGLDDQVNLLVGRGMRIDDPAAAASFLGQVNYYRFVGYGLPFEERGAAGERLDRYVSGTSFEDVVRIYEFDTALRNLLWRYLEFVEIALRTAICYVMSTETGDPFWFTKAEYFSDSGRHAGFLAACESEFTREKPEAFIRAYKAKYSATGLPPCWILIEIVAFGSWSKAYSQLRHQRLRKRIASCFRTHPKFLTSWTHTLAVLRNICAHHLRLWNRTFPIPPRVSPRMRNMIADHQRVAAPIYALREMLLPLNRANGFEAELAALLQANPHVNRTQMGLAAGGRK